MKSIKNSILILILSLTFQSCTEEFLEVELKNDLGVESYYKTPEHAFDALTACYDPIKGRGFMGMTYQYVLYAFDDRCINENSALNEFAYAATTNQFQGGQYNWSPWAFCYKGVFRCNLALQHIPGIEIPGEEPTGYSKKERYLAEARFMRAMYYFYLTIHYYHPILLEEPAFDMTYPYTNASNQELWKFIEDDLLYAIDNLPKKSEYAKKDMGRATWGAAKALLGKSYLYQQKWSQAQNEFNDIIQSSEYALSLPAGTDSIDYVNAYLANFSYMDLPGKEGTVYDAEHNSESVFEIKFINAHENVINEWNPGLQGDGSLLAQYFGPEGFKNVVPKAEMVEEFEATPAGHPCPKDPRLYASIFREGDMVDVFNPDNPQYMVPFNQYLHSNSGITEGYGLKKYYFPNHRDDAYGEFLDPTNVRVIRYADILLMYAEASYHTGTGDGLGALNQVRARAGLEPVDALTPQAIMHERDVEFFGEWLRFPDLVRWSQLPTPWVQPEDIHPNFQKNKHEYFPMPQKTIVRLKGSLKQSPGW